MSAGDGPTRRYSMLDVPVESVARGSGEGGRPAALAKLAGREGFRGLPPRSASFELRPPTQEPLRASLQGQSPVSNDSVHGGAASEPSPSPSSSETATPSSSTLTLGSPAGGGVLEILIPGRDLPAPAFERERLTDTRLWVTRRRPVATGLGSPVDPSTVGLRRRSHEFRSRPAPISLPSLSTSPLVSPVLISASAGHLGPWASGGHAGPSGLARALNATPSPASPRSPSDGPGTPLRRRPPAPAPLEMRPASPAGSPPLAGGLFHRLRPLRAPPSPDGGPEPAPGLERCESFSPPGPGPAWPQPAGPGSPTGAAVSPVSEPAYLSLLPPMPRPSLALPPPLLPVLLAPPHAAHIASAAAPDEPAPAPARPAACARGPLAPESLLCALERLRSEREAAEGAEGSEPSSGPSTRREEGDEEGDWRRATSPADWAEAAIADPSQAAARLGPQRRGFLSHRAPARPPSPDGQGQAEEAAAGGSAAGARARPGERDGADTTPASASILAVLRRLSCAPSADA